MQSVTLSYPTEAAYVATMAAAYAEVGDFEQAVVLQKRAIDLVASAKSKKKMRRALEKFEQGIPLRGKAR